MSIFSDVFGWSFHGINNPQDQRALSADEIAEMMLASARLQAQAQMNAGNLYAMAAWRPPVFVLPGWADWFAMGDELR